MLHNSLPLTTADPCQSGWEAALNIALNSSYTRAVRGRYGRQVSRKVSRNDLRRARTSTPARVPRRTLPASGRTALYVLLAPLYLFGLILLGKSGIYLLWGNPTANSGQMYQASLTFLASALATGIGAVGLWFSKSHQDRTESRLRLESATSGLELIGQGDGYAPSARVAGALATLVHLDHPTIAIRALRAAWKDGAVDIETATWVIGEVLQSGTAESQLEAADLLYSRSAVLCEDGPDGTLEVHWPYPILEAWPSHLPLDARCDVLGALVSMLVSRPVETWRTGRRHFWAIALLDEAIQREPDQILRAEAARAQRTVLTTVDGGGKVVVGHSWRTVVDLRARAGATELVDMRLSAFVGLDPRLRAWAAAAESVPA